FGVLVQVRERIGGEALDLGRERAVALIEEGPGEKGAIGHGAQLPSNAGGRFSTNARYARRKSSVCMHRAWACASASIAASMLMSHSWLSIVLVIIWAKVGPAASFAASSSASSSRRARGHRRLKKPH